MLLSKAKAEMTLSLGNRISVHRGGFRVWDLAMATKIKWFRRFRVCSIRVYGRGPGVFLTL